MAAQSNVQGADKGMDYQYQVMTYMLVSLLENPNVEDFIAYANLTNAGKFDDIIMKVWFVTELHPYVYAVQVKHSSDCFDLSDNKNKKGISTYAKSFKEMMNKKAEIPYLSDVPEENIKFWFFCSEDLKDVNVCRGADILYKCDFRQLTYTHMTIVPIEQINEFCYKLYSIKAGEFQEFFDKFYLFLKQPKNEEIGGNIKGISGIADSIITKYVQKYFNKEELCKNGLTKQIFELEVLLSRLTPYIPVLSAGTLETNAAYARIWNKITLAHDVTAVGNFEHMERLVFDCCLQKANDLFGETIDWNNYLNSNSFHFDDIIQEKFKKYADTKKIRHWVDEPRTVRRLLKELWIYDEMPLILETDIDPVEAIFLNKYKHLRKKYIVISNIAKVYDTLGPLYNNIFTNISDICDNALRDELLQSVTISLQGRKPVSLDSIIGEDQSAQKAFTCSEILNLIVKRKVYLGNNFMTEAELMIFIIEDANSQSNQDDIKRIQPEDQNSIVITCQKFEEIKTYFDRVIAEDTNFRNYTTCCLRLENDKYKFLEGHLEKLRYFFVDEFGHDIYIVDVKEPVPIIGQRLCRRIPLYIPRYLSKSEVFESVIDVEKKCIVFVSGEIETLQLDIKNQIVEYHIDDGRDIQFGDNNVVFINVGNFIVDYWRIFPQEDYQLIHVQVVDGCFILVEQRNCPKIISYTSYDSREFKEEVFSKEMDNKVIVLQGESGIGKSALLQSLVETSDGSNYVLFCNLADLRDEMKLEKKLLQSPLDFLFDKYESSMYNTLLDQVYKHHKKSGRLTIFIDSFDEMLPLALCKDTALVFMKRIIESGVKVVVTCTLISGNLLMNNLLLNRIKVQPFRVNYLKPNEASIYFNGKGVLDFVSDKIPHEFLVNPSYLEFMHFYYKRSTLKFASCDKSDLCWKIIMKKVEQYYCADQGYVLEDEIANEVQNEDVLDVHRHIALAQMLGENYVTKYVPTRYDKLIKEFQDIKIRLGIVKGFKGDCPRFANRVIMEFLVEQWFKQDNMDEEDRNSFIADYNSNAKHFFLSPEN